MSNQPAGVQQLQQQQQQIQFQNQTTSQQQQQVPLTTIMIPASAAAQIQSASMQIQQAAMQATASNPTLQQTPQVMVFMIPYMINQPSIITPTPEQASSNSTLVRQSQSNSSIMRQSQTQSQSHTTSSHSRAVSSLSGLAKQDSEKFYVKANFSYQATRNRQELSFRKGDILHVLDTLQNNDYGVQYWLATRVKPNGEDAEKGLIPNKNKAEEIALEQRTMNIGEAGGTLDGESGGVLSASMGRVNFLKRKAAQRSKSLCKDNWDNVVFDIGSSKLLTYERVVFKHPGFCRPVVIFGPLSDIAREKLLKDYPEKYSHPTGLSQSPDHPKVIRLKGVLDVIDQGKHALLDITAPAVEKLNYVNLAPIVIFMKTESKSVIKEFRSRAAKSLDMNTRDEDTLRRDSKSSRKLLEQSVKLEKQWSHVFTATLDLSTMGSEMWYRKLRETIENQQSANVWMGERKSDKKSAASNTNIGETAVYPAVAGTSNNQHPQHPLQHSTSCLADSSSMLNERFSECLNISNAKSTNDLTPIISNEVNYGNRSVLRSAYARSLAQKLARASSEPKLNGIISDNDDDDDDVHDDDDDDIDDEILKKPFPAEFENSSSISSSNGVNSYGQCSLPGGMGLASYQQQPQQQQQPQPHYQIQQQIPHQVKPPPPPPPPEQSLSGQLQHRLAQQDSIYSSRNPVAGSSYTNGNSGGSSGNQHRDYHLLPPMPSDNGYSQHHHQQNQSHLHSLGHNGNNATTSSAANNVIDLSRNHESRGSAFQVYSDMNQNSYDYYNLNKI